MQLNSFIFILAYLPILLVAYFLTNKVNAKLGRIVLLAGSFVFYFYGGLKSAIVFMVSIVINLVLTILITKKQEHKKVFLTIAVVTNILLLGFFKYSLFVVSNINSLFQKEFTLNNVILPLGISFFTFQQIMYVVNVYKGELDGTKIFDYLTYITFFPKIIMGPITEPGLLIPQFNDETKKSLNWDNLAAGIKMFSFGLFKKLVIADNLAKIVGWGYSDVLVPTSFDWLIILLIYPIELYFDFSGYSDMAIGASLMFNIELPMNFDSPYKSLSIPELWRRWHITLSDFLTKYIYIPLGGNRKGKIRTYINIIIIFLVSGLWHGANWTYILWGFLHGVISCIDRILKPYKSDKKFLNPVRWIVFYAEWVITLALFRADSIGQWKDILGKLFSFDNIGMSEELANMSFLPALTLRPLGGITVHGVGILMTLFASYALCLLAPNNYRSRSKNNVLTMILAVCAFVCGFACLGSESVFVYLNF